jgi:hypothetical protein
MSPKKFSWLSKGRDIKGSILCLRKVPQGLFKVIQIYTIDFKRIYKIATEMFTINTIILWTIIIDAH